MAKFCVISECTITGRWCNYRTKLRTKILFVTKLKLQLDFEEDKSLKTVITKTFFQSSEVA